MLHFFNCKKLKYIHDEPYTLVGCHRERITVEKGDELILDDGAMYRSLRYKTRLFKEVPLKKAKPKSQEPTESNKDEQSLTLEESVENAQLAQPQESDEE